MIPGCGVIAGMINLLVRASYPLARPMTSTLQGLRPQGVRGQIPGRIFTGQTFRSRNLSTCGKKFFARRIVSVIIALIKKLEADTQA
jgi:hypothetical protein